MSGRCPVSPTFWRRRCFGVEETVLCKSSLSEMPSASVGSTALPGLADLEGGGSEAPASEAPAAPLFSGASPIAPASPTSPAAIAARTASDWPSKSGATACCRSTPAPAFSQLSDTAYSETSAPAQASSTPVQPAIASRRSRPTADEPQRIAAEPTTPAKSRRSGALTSCSTGTNSIGSSKHGQAAMSAITGGRR